MKQKGKKKKDEINPEGNLTAISWLSWKLFELN